MSELLIALAVLWLAGGLWFVWHARDGSLIANLFLVLLWPVHLAAHRNQGDGK